MRHSLNQARHLTNHLAESNLEFWKSDVYFNLYSNFEYYSQLYEVLQVALEVLNEDD